MYQYKTENFFIDSSHPFIKAVREGDLNTICNWIESGNIQNINAVDDNNNNLLHTAAMFDRSDVIEVLIMANADVNAQNKARWTPLHFAASGGYMNALCVLLNNNAFVQPLNSQGNTPLHVAAELGHRATVEILLKANADVDAMNSLTGDTPLHIAAKGGHIATMRALIAANADVTAVNAKGFNPLEQLAYYYGNEKVIELLNQPARTYRY